MTPGEIRSLWTMLVQTWGQKFPEQYGTVPNDAWTAGLARLPIEAGRFAYGRAIKDSPTFPPTLPEFLAWASAYRPPATTKALPSNGKPEDLSTQDLRDACSPEIKMLMSYHEYEQLRRANSRNGKMPDHPTPQSADWLYLQRLAWIQAAAQNRRTVASLRS